MTKDEVQRRRWTFYEAVKYNRRIGEDSRFLFFARLWHAPFRSLPGAGSLLSNQLCHNLNVIGVRKHVNRLDFGYLVIAAHFSKISC